MRWTFALLCAVIGCVSAPKATLIKPNDPAIRYGGFVDHSAPAAPRFAWSGSHIEARFTGATLLAKLSSTPVDPQLPETDFIEVILDDGPPRTFQLDEGEHWYPLATNLAPGPHRVLIWKRTECGVAFTTFYGFKLDDGEKLGPPLPAPSRRILFIGDSITAGFGNEGPNAECGWSAALENNYLTYGAVAARALGAEYIGQAWSGKGISRNYDASDQGTMPQLYRRVIPTDPDSPAVPRLTADAIVVNLGTNDFGQGEPDGAEVIGAFGALLRELRASHPKALIVLMLGPMLYDVQAGVPQRTLMRGWLNQVKQQRASQGDAAIELFEVWTDPKEGLGCASHPSLATHARIGRSLAELLRKRLKW